MTREDREREWEEEIRGFRQLLDEAARARKNGEEHALSHASEEDLFFLRERIDAVSAELLQVIQGPVPPAEHRQRLARRLLHLRVIFEELACGPGRPPKRS